MAFPMLPPSGPPMGGGGPMPPLPPAPPAPPKKKQPSPAGAKNKALASKLGKGKGASK